MNGDHATMRGHGKFAYRRLPAFAVVRVVGLALAAITIARPVGATTLLPDSAVTATSPTNFPALPSFPDLNWADFPIKLSVQDSVVYNDNVFALPQNATTFAGLKSRGDLYNLTVLGANSQYYLGQQKISLSGSYGLTRYLTDTVANSNQYNLNAGWDWAFTSRCSGTLATTISKLPSVAEQQIGAGVNNSKSQSFTETAKCLVWGGFSVVANSGRSSSQNSNALNSLIDSNSKYIETGVVYDWSALDNSQLLYRHTDRINPNRTSVLNAAGLAGEVIEDDFTLSYHRYFSQAIDASATAGLTQIHLLSTGAVGASTTVAPHYALNVNWRPSDKLALQASIARTVGAPTTVLANDQVSDTASLSAYYYWSQKTTFNANLSMGNATRAFLQGASATTLFGNSKYMTAAVGVSYRMTPFISGNLNYQYTDSRGLGLDTVVNRVTVSMNYAPY